MLLRTRRRHETCRRDTHVGYGSLNLGPVHFMDQHDETGESGPVGVRLVESNVP